MSHAVTAVSHDTFVNARPVAAATVRVNAQQMQAAEVQRNFHVAPVQKSVVGAGAVATVKPPAAVMQRQVVAKVTPAPPRASFNSSIPQARRRLSGRPSRRDSNRNNKCNRGSSRHSTAAHSGATAYPQQQHNSASSGATTTAIAATTAGRSRNFSARRSRNAAATRPQVNQTHNPPVQQNPSREICAAGREPPRTPITRINLKNRKKPRRRNQPLRLQRQKKRRNLRSAGRNQRSRPMKKRRK